MFTQNQNYDTTTTTNGNENSLLHLQTFDSTKFLFYVLGETGETKKTISTNDFQRESRCIETQRERERAIIIQVNTV